MPAAPQSWYCSLADVESIELVVTMVKSPGEVCVFPRLQVELLHLVQAHLGPHCLPVPEPMLRVGLKVTAPRQGTWA